MTASLETRLLKRKTSGNFRQLQVLHGLVDFSSNDYLGLARSEDFARAVSLCKGELNSLGSTGSRLLTGNTLYAQMLENTIAAFHGYEAGILFSCGYMANVGLMSTVAGNDDTIFFDSFIHASCRDGISLSRAQSFPFRHNNLEHLENRLKNCSIRGNRFICIESIYSTDGSVAPLKEIALLTKKYEAHLIVDEAHAIGVYGLEGRGLAESSDVFAKVITFGKALGTYGAIVLGSAILKDALINFATSYIYTTALPFHCLAAIKCSYDTFPKLVKERKHIAHLIKKISSTTHIHPIFIKGSKNALCAAKALREKGFDVRALLSPTVRRGHELLRICLHAFNTEDEVKALLGYL